MLAIGSGSSGTAGLPRMTGTLPLIPPGAAFLARDLAHLGRAGLAQAFVDAYVAASGDAELPRLLPFYLCYRAFVRGKVLGFRLDQPGLAPDEVVELVLPEWVYTAGDPLQLVIGGEEVGL